MSRSGQLRHQGFADHSGRSDHENAHQHVSFGSVKALLQRALISGSVASVVSTVAASCFSQRQSGTATGATNATSHWVWGDQAMRQRRLSVRHTALGYAIHHASSVFWAALFEQAIGRTRSTKAIAAGAAITAGVAYVVDYHVVPKRLTPGFESRLSPAAMAGTYAAFALGLGFGAWAYRRFARRHAIAPRMPPGRRAVPLPQEQAPRPTASP